MSAVPAAHASPSLDSTTRVRDLAPLERWVLGVTLALLDDPEILLVDDIDGLRGSDDRAAAWAVLASLAGSPVRRTARTQPARALTVVVSCRDLHEATDALAGAGGIPEGGASGTRASRAEHPLAAVIAGVLAGFATMTANAAGAVMTLYLLAMRVEKVRFIGTSAWFFLIVNVSKLPFSASLGLFPAETLKLSAMLAPLVLVGTWLGILLLQRLSQLTFERAALAGSVVAAVALLVR